MNSKDNLLWEEYSNGDARPPGGFPAVTAVTRLWHSMSGRTALAEGGTGWQVLLPLKFQDYAGIPIHIHAVQT